MDEWTPLDDIGRREANLAYQAHRTAQGLIRLQAARERALGSIDRLSEAFSDGKVDWTAATPSEAEEMAQALDTIHSVRELVRATPT